MKLRVYFATNRNPLPKKKGYFGVKPSPVHTDELRFGEASVTVDADDLDRPGRKLRSHLARAFKRGQGTVRVYGERLSADPPVYGSTRLFQNLKASMDLGCDVLIYVHGYSVSFTDALASACTLRHKLTSDTRSLEVVAFTWPSDGTKFPKRAYSRDRRDAETSADAFARGFLKLRDFMRGIAREDWCSGRIHLMCHSMGNYVLQNTLQALGDLQPGPLPRIFTEALCVAADVDDDAFDHRYKLGRLPEIAQRVAVYCNNEDLAMDLSEITKGNPRRLGHSGPARPRDLPAGVFSLDASDIVGGVAEHAYHFDEIVPDLRAVLAGTRHDQIPQRTYEPAANTYYLRE